MAASNRGAMALLEKYELLTKGIQDARNEIIKQTSKLENISQIISESQIERKDMQEKEKDLVAELKGLEHSFRSVSEEFQILENEIDALKQKKGVLENNIKLLQKYLDDERQTFLSRSRDFRAFCRRSKLQLLSMPLLPGEDESIIDVKDDALRRVTTLDENFGFGRLLASSSEDDESDGYSDEELLDSQIKSKENNQNKVMVTTSRNETNSPSEITASIPITRTKKNEVNGEKDHEGEEDKMFESLILLSKKRRRRRRPTSTRRKTLKTKKSLKVIDEDLDQAYARHRQAVQERGLTIQELEKVKSNYDAATLRAKDRSNKLEQQRDQLQRVRKIVQEMENELAEVRFQSRELEGWYYIDFVSIWSY